MLLNAWMFCNFMRRQEQERRWAGEGQVADRRGCDAPLAGELKAPCETAALVSRLDSLLSQPGTPFRIGHSSYRNRHSHARTVLFAGPPAIANLLLRQGLPNSDDFVPFTFLAETHRDTRIGELAEGRERLERDRAERLGQMKALVKENFDRFVRAKEDIDRVHLLLVDMESDSTEGAYSTASMSARIKRIQAEADDIMKPLLHFQGERDRIRLVLSLMRRYKPLFQLPSRIRQFARQGDVPRALREWCAEVLL